MKRWAVAIVTTFVVGCSGGEGGTGAPTTPEDAQVETASEEPSVELGPELQPEPTPEAGPEPAQETGPDAPLEASVDASDAAADGPDDADATAEAEVSESGTDADAAEAPATCACVTALYPYVVNGVGGPGGVVAKCPAGAVLFAQEDGWCDCSQAAYPLPDGWGCYPPAGQTCGTHIRCSGPWCPDTQQPCE